MISRAVDLHPLAVAFMMLVIGALFGVLGAVLAVLDAVLAVPAAAILKTPYQELYPPRQITDPEALVERSERVVADAGGPRAVADGRAQQRRGETVP